MMRSLLTRKPSRRLIIDRVARTGLVAKGIIYLLFGGLVAYAAATGRGRVTDEQGAMTALFEQPFGRFILAVLGVGLLAYSVWRLYQLVFNPEETEGFWTARGKPLLSSIVYGSLGVEAVKMVAGYSRGGEGEGDTRQQAAGVMALPLGHWLLAVFGAVLFVSAAYDLWQALSGRSEPEGKPDKAALRKWNERLSRFAETTRGLLGLLGGGYLVIAALHRSPGQVRGSRGALEKIAEQPFGRWLLLVTALGLLFYGVVQFIAARYREVKS